ncbi:hypothetical protein [Prevotella multiformis]|uniref:Uncharacterized protein n=1 Tax=Prevotella multiformis DSM 16608 TaxID=888743 RepID=F0F498_9BACT|nr:hypothetical protein [Prevotella multiformis]EGC21056.1 hypothetical protein HMPREF9141_0414 [Prevotella multiformis DSM 16608]
MAVARNQITITSEQRDYTFLRYSDDGGKTFTAARPITQAQADAPGRNLARGTADFSGGKANWNMDYRIKPTDEKYMGLTVIRIPDSWNQAGSIVPCRAGKTYTFSFWARVDELEGGRCGGVIRNCRKGEHYEYVSYDGIKTGNSLYLTYTKEWKRHTFVLRFLKDAPNAAFSVEKDANGNTLFVCGFKVEEGETATPWSPAPEDQQRGTTPGKYLGTLVWDKPYPSMDTSAYTWSEVQGIQGERGEKGEAAEVYRLNVVEETAKVTPAGVLYVSLSYSVLHIQGGKVENVGNLDDFRVVCESDTHDSATVEKGIGFVCKYTMNDYFANSNRPSFFRVQLFRGNELQDERVVNVQLEAASYVEVVGDLRKTVSQHGRNISRIEQKADGISLKVEGMKNGVRNLLKGGRLNVSFSTYGLPSAFRLKLKPDTDYTLTVCGRISEDALKKGQTLRTYVFDKDWKWSADFGIQSTSDTAASVTFRIPADRHSPEDYYISCFPFPNQEPKGKNGEVTVSWIVLTEGTQAAASWIPAEGEDVEARMKSAGMEIKDGEITLTANRTKIRNNKGEDIAVFNEDGTVDARRILMRCRFGNITFGEVDGYPNIIITNALNQPMLMLNHRGIVSPYGADIVLLNCSEYFTRRDEAVLGVNIVVRVTNMGFQEQTFGDNIRLTATLGGGLNRTLTLVLGEYHVKGIADPGIAVAAKQPVTLKIGETGTLVYGAHHTVGSTSGGNLVAQSVSFSVRATYADKVVDGSYTERLDASDGLPDFSGGLPGGGLPGGGNILSGL